MSGKKRGQGEGSIYQRGDGRWCATVSLGFEGDGKRQRKTVYGSTRKEVADKLKELQRAVDAGLPPAREDVTVKDLMDEWMKEIVVPTVRPKTLRSYEQLTRVHIVPKLGKAKVAKLDAKTVQAFLRERQESGLSPRTVLHLRAVLRRAFEFAVRWAWVQRNVITLTDGPKQEHKEVRALSPEEAKALLAAFAGHRLEHLVTVTLGLGLRIGEALGLRWQDIRFSGAESGTVTIRVQLQKVAGQNTLLPPKSRAGKRTVPLPGFVVKALLARKAEQEQELARLWEGANPLGLVFTTYGGDPLMYGNVYRDFLAVLRRNGIAPIRPHDLRHACASLLLAQGVPPRVIMEILGHSQISLTMNTYGHVLPTATQAAAEAMHRLFGADESDGNEESENGV